MYNVFPLFSLISYIIYIDTKRCGTGSQDQKAGVPTGGLEPPIFGLGDRRLIHWAPRAELRSVVFRDLFSLLGNPELFD